MTRPCERALLAGLGCCRPRTKKSLLVVVNDDTDNAQDLKLTGEIERLQDLRTGKRLELDTDGIVKLHLEAGDGTVLQMP